MSGLIVKVLLIGAGLLFLMWPASIGWGAPALPDSVNVEKSQSFTDVLETGDVLFVAKFTITYANCNSTVQTGCPTETISDTFIGSLLDDTACTPNDTTLRLTNPVTSTSPGLNGYGAGVFSIYLNAADTTSLIGGQANVACHALEIEGNPAQFPDPSLARDELTVSAATFALAPTIRARAEELEQSWGITLLQTGGGFLDADGEDYFERAIPNLRQMSGGSALFSGAIITPEVFAETFDTSHDTELRNFGAGNAAWDEWNTAFTDLDTATGIDSQWWKVTIALIAAAGVVMWVGRYTQDGRIATLTIPITLSVFTLTGFVPLAFVAIMAIFSAIVLAYLMFLKGA